METPSALTKRILNRIKQHQHDLADKQQQLTHGGQQFAGDLYHSVLIWQRCSNLKT